MRPPPPPLDYKVPFSRVDRPCPVCRVVVTFGPECQRCGKTYHAGCGVTGVEGPRADEFAMCSRCIAMQYALEDPT